MLFPTLSATELNLVVEKVSPPAVTKRLVKEMQNVFHNIDKKLTGKCDVYALCHGCKQEKSLLPFLTHVNMRRFVPGQKVTLQTWLTACFKKSPWAKNLQQVLKWSKPLLEEQIEEIEKLFNYYDKDGSGTLTIDEVHQMGPLGLSQEEMNEMYEDIDFDGDGEVTLAEFLRFYERFWDAHQDKEMESKMRRKDAERHSKGGNKLHSASQSHSVFDMKRGKDEGHLGAQMSLHRHFRSKYAKKNEVTPIPDHVLQQVSLSTGPNDF